MWGSLTERAAAVEKITTETGLLARLRAGEDAAFGELVRAHSGRMLAVAKRILGSEADAEDVVQEAFVSAFRHLAAFDGRSALGTWLHRIAVNAALMKRRRGRSRPETSIQAWLPEFSDGFHKDAPRPFEHVTQVPGGGIVDSGAILAALDELPDEFRDVVVLRDIEGLDSKAAGASLGISDSLVRQRLHRGRQALMKLLEERMKGTE